MVNNRWLSGLVLAALLVLPACFAADVSTIATETRYDVNAAGIQGIKSIPQNEIRRIPDMIDNPKSQIGVWVPMVEPEPIIRGFNNRIADNVEIFKNTGSTKDKYPYIVKVVKNREGKTDQQGFFVYRNVKYDWAFEAAGDDEESGGKNGASFEGKPWTPFYNQGGEEKALEYMRDMAKNGTTEMWDPKAYANVHAKPFDSGISGDADTKGSTVLQEVGMLLTYERASVNVSTSAKGYNGNADLNQIAPGSIPEVQLNAEPSGWQPGKVLNAAPAGWKLEVGGTTQLTAYNRVYVEDYSAPTTKDTEVKVYRGGTGGFVSQVWNKKENKWDPIDGIRFEYQDNNPDAAVSSDRLQASLNYESGNGDIYRLPNPGYNPDDPSSEPFVYFTYLPCTYKMTWNSGEQKWERVKIADNPVKYDETVVYGPYVGPAKKAEEYYFYKNLDPFWSKKPAADIENYVKSRYANAYDGKSLPSWARGLVYFIIDERNSGLLKIKQLNGFCNSAKNKKNEGLDAKMPEIQQLMKEYATLGTKAGAEASEDIAAFRNHLLKQGVSNVNRFSYIEFKDGGRYCVGPIEFEKNDGAVHQEKVEEVNGQRVKTGYWFVPGPRVLMAKHYSTASLEWDHTGVVAKKEASTMNADASGYKVVRQNDGNYVYRRADGADAQDGPSAATVANDSTTGLTQKYGKEWMQAVPDLMYKVDMADCCGNTTNQIGFIKTQSNGEETHLPVPEVSITGTNGEHKVFVPTDESLTNEQGLVINGNSSEMVKTGEYNTSEINLTDNNISVAELDKNGSLVKINDPIGKDLLGQVKDTAIFEDERLLIAATAYGAVDRPMKHKGITSARIQIQQMDSEGKKVIDGKFEDLEMDKSDANLNWDESNRMLSKVPSGKPEDFDPTIKFYHIFRNPGWYQVNYTATDNTPLSRTLKFRVNVLDAKVQIKTLDTNQDRK